MPWERGAWEKTTSRGGYKSIHEGNLNGQRINEQTSPKVNVSGGVSFCPKCGSMMRNNNGILTCSQCGYNKSSNISSNGINHLNISKQQEIEHQKTKKEMDDILLYMNNGNSRSQASKLAGVPISKISHWYNEGRNGNGIDNIHFYHEVLSIEINQEKRKRDEINRQNRLKEQKYQHKQRETKQKREKLQSHSEYDSIKKQMDEIIKQMRNGETRSQAAINVGVPIYTVDEWYDTGWRKNKEPYTTFYNKVNTIEIRRKKNQSSTSENNKTKHVSSSKSKTKTILTSSKNDILKQMDEIVRQMKKGLTRSEAAKNVGLNVVTVNNWYNKGSHGDLTYIKFYNSVKSIENNRKSSNTLNMIKCPKCGKYYSKSKSNCPHCTSQTSALASVKYCQNCGKKITTNDLFYCTKCGASLKNGKKPKSSSTVKKSSNNNTPNWINCCIVLFVIFIFMALIGLI